MAFSLDARKISNIDKDARTRKMKFASREQIYKWFQEDDSPEILVGTMRLLTRARQIVIVDLDYDASSGIQVEKKKSRELGRQTKP